MYYHADYLDGHQHSGPLRREASYILGQLQQPPSGALSSLLAWFQRDSFAAPLLFLSRWLRLCQTQTCCSSLIHDIVPQPVGLISLLFTGSPDCVSVWSRSHPNTLSTCIKYAADITHAASPGPGHPGTLLRVKMEFGVDDGGQRMFCLSTSLIKLICCSKQGKSPVLSLNPSLTISFPLSNSESSRPRY